MVSNLSDTIRSEFPRRRIVIIGDLVADQFLMGTIDRVSREAPVFILCHDETETRPGSAANAAVNIAAMGGEPLLIGVTGRDDNAELLRGALAASKIDCSLIVDDANLRTTTKVRVLAGQHYAGRQQVIRIDYENRKAIGPNSFACLIDNLQNSAESADAIIVSDYNYGVASADIFAAARKIAESRRIPLIVDSRFGLRNFAGATSATPNQEEIEAILGKNFADEDCSALREELGFGSMLVTCGNAGVVLFERNCDPVRFAAIGSTEPVDVTGAGDTVIAAFSLGLASGLNPADAALVANHAGGIVVMKKGTASATTNEILASLAETEGIAATGSVL